MDTKEQMMTRRIGSWRFQQMQVTSLSSILLETTLIWKFHKVDDFYYRTQKGRHPWFSNLKFSILKKKKCNLFFLSDPYEDQFAKKIEAKKERIAKNEYQRLRNIARNKKIAGKLTWILL